MSYVKSLLLVGCARVLVSVAAYSAAAPQGSEALKGYGLTPSATAYVLSDEADVLKDLPGLHQTKKKFDAEARIRKGYEAKIKTSHTFVEQSIKEHEQLKDRLSVVTNAASHNKIVVRMNALLIKIKESMATRKEAEESLAKMGSELPTKYVDDVIALDDKAQAVTKHYAELAADPAVKAAINKANHAASTTLKLGPSAEFATAAAELAKYRSEIEAEAIPLQEVGGVHTVDVLIGGETVKMILDVGASMVTLTGEDAEKLKVSPGPNDPVVEMKLADGHVIHAQVITLKSVRLGRFTVENVTCAVMAKGLNGAAALLGNTFLSHFVVKLDQQAGQLHLIEVDSAEKKTVPTVGSPAPDEK